MSRFRKKTDLTSLLRTKEGIVRDANYVAVFDYQPTWAVKELCVTGNDLNNLTAKYE